MDIELIRAVANHTEDDLVRRRRALGRAHERPHLVGESGRGKRNGDPWASMVRRPRGIRVWQDPNGDRVAEVERADGTVFTCVSDRLGRGPITEGRHHWPGNTGTMLAVIMHSGPWW